jgi:hypothetical protein
MITLDQFRRRNEGTSGDAADKTAAADHPGQPDQPEIRETLDPEAEREMVAALTNRTRNPR